MRMSSRKIPPSYAKGARGLVTTPKAVGPAMYESSLERDYMLLLDFDRRVARFQVQPITIDLSHLAGYRHYTPDILVTWQPDYGKPWLVEVKPEDELHRQWAALKPKFRAAIQRCRQEGWVFHLVTERHVRTPLLENVKFLRDYRHFAPAPQHIAALAQAGRTRRAITQLCAALAPSAPADVLPVIWHSLWAGLLRTDLALPLDMQTEVVWHGQ